MGLSGTIWDYLELSELSETILDYMGLSRTKVQIKAGESKLLLFETFGVFLPTGSIEELALLKTVLLIHNRNWPNLLSCPS